MKMDSDYDPTDSDAYSLGEPSIMPEEMERAIKLLKQKNLQEQTG